MARDRQRSKQRQAERRARRLEQQGAPQRGDGAAIPGVTPEPVEPADGPGPPGIDADHLEAGAPPEELGRSDFSLEHDEAIVDREEHEAALDDDEAARLAEEEEAYAADRGLGGHADADDFAEDDLVEASARPERASPATRSRAVAVAPTARHTSTARVSYSS